MVLKSLILQGFKSFPDKHRDQISRRHYGDRRSERLGKIEYFGCHPVGSGRAVLAVSARRQDGGRDLRRHSQARSGRLCRGFAHSGQFGAVFRSEFTEIMVTRRYYRSGESEYFLNKKHCRLSDVHELFMDTGLGRDGYSIIGQGRIDEILSLQERGPARDLRGSRRHHQISLP